MRLPTSWTVSKYMCEVTVIAATGTLLSRMTGLAMTYQGELGAQRALEPSGLACPVWRMDTYIIWVSQVPGIQDAT